MKIKDFAVENGITQTAVYKAIKRRGLSTKDFTDRQGNLTEKGLSTLRKLFPESPQEQEKDSALAEALRKAEERAAQWEQRYIDLVEQSAQERAELRKQIEQAHILLAREQQGRGFFKRLFAGKGDEK